MNVWLLLAVVVLVLYGVLLLLRFTFQMIDHAHELQRERERRNAGVSPLGERES